NQRQQPPRNSSPSSRTVSSAARRFMSVRAWTRRSIIVCSDRATGRTMKFSSGAGCRNVEAQETVLPAPSAAPALPDSQPKKCIKQAAAGSSKVEGERHPCKGNDMATSQTSEVIQQLRRAVLLRDGAGLTDGQLLRDYLSRREEAALAALVRRHGPMVWGV